MLFGASTCRIVILLKLASSVLPCLIAYVGLGDCFLGSSRRHLSELFKALDKLDIFAHDSLHTSRNVRFELDYVWDRIRPGGVAIVDDVNENLVFQSFVKLYKAKDYYLGGHPAWELFRVTYRAPNGSSPPYASFGLSRTHDLSP